MNKITSNEKAARKRPLSLGEIVAYAVRATLLREAR